jgi:hypothetical protein
LAEIEYIPIMTEGSTAMPAISHETPVAIADLLRHHQTIAEPQHQASVVTLLTGAYAVAQVVPEVIRNQTAAQQRFEADADKNLLSNLSASLGRLGADPPDPVKP